MGINNPLRDILSQPFRKAVILDGGFGTELERSQGKDYAQDPLWSARILVDDPAAVQRVHRAYYDAGADVGITCSYQASYPGFERAGFSHDEATGLFRKSIQLAAAARDDFWAQQQQKAGAEEVGKPGWKNRRVRPLVAFSCGPYAATLADGSEYTGAYVDNLPFEDLVAFHRSKLQAIAGEPGVDLLAFETIPSLTEGQAIVHLLKSEPPGIPAWLSFSCKDEQHVSHGEDFAKEAVLLVCEADSIVAVGVNCTPPRFVPQLLRSAKATLEGKAKAPLLVCYPNSGEGWVNKTGDWDGDSDLKGCDLGQVGQEWVNAGASLVGGCCRTTPEYITELAAALT